MVSFGRYSSFYPDGAAAAIQDAAAEVLAEAAAVLAAGELPALGNASDIMQSTYLTQSVVEKRRVLNPLHE